jgi:hypothetical protein
MAHVIRVAEHLTRAEDRVRAACQHLPGVLILGAVVTSGPKSREVDAILLTPTGLFAIEAKGTNQSGQVETSPNGTWTIGEERADFAGGANPLRQARRAAQMLRAMLSDADVDSPFIPAIVAVSGDDIDLPPSRVGDTWATSVEHLAATLLRQRPQRVSLADAGAILAVLEVNADTVDLAEQGFSDQPGDEDEDDDSEAGYTRPAEPSGVPLNSRGRRRARRYDEMVQHSHREWRTSNRRRLGGSTLSIAVIAATLPYLRADSYVTGPLLMAAVAAWQLAVRYRKSGPRDSGPLAIAAWLFTLVPVAGIGATLSALTALPTTQRDAQGPLTILLVLIALLLGLCMLPGRSAFVHPPAVVLERHDVNGRPTGAFMLADATPRTRKSLGWRKVGQEDSDATAADTPDATTSEKDTVATGGPAAN